MEHVAPAVTEQYVKLMQKITDDGGSATKKKVWSISELYPENSGQINFSFIMHWLVQPSISRGSIKQNIFFLAM